MDRPAVREKRAANCVSDDGGEAAERKRHCGYVQPVAHTDGPDWTVLIKLLRPAIVALKVSTVRCFEEEQACTSHGTGFVVDKARGLILTNRHVLGVGPIRAFAVFDRHEELHVEAVYRDPLHDFGFLRFDPSQLRLTSAAEISLEPSGLQVGTEIRVVGNDAGEKLQILSGTIARVDRNVPEYESEYNDENTFYAGAGAGTSGGSSGSPVLNKQGNAIALNAAGQDGAASSYFLPLDRVAHTLALIQGSKPVPRGTLFCKLLFKPFDDLKRIGLRERDEQSVLENCSGSTGLLVVETSQPEQTTLRPGDILLRIQGEIVRDFAHFEDVLDAAVGKSVEITICRAGEEHKMSLHVADLHNRIPRSFVELGLDVCHDLGYHAAKRFHVPMGSGVYLARCGFVFSALGCADGSLVTKLNGQEVRTLNDFVSALLKIPDQQYFEVSWYELPEFFKDRTLKSGSAKMSCAWSPMRLWTCHGAGGVSENWVAQVLPTSPAQALQKIEPVAAQSGGERLLKLVRRSLVSITFRTDKRFNMEGLPEATAEGAGLLLDINSGLILTDRHTVPQSLGDIEVNFMGAATLDARVLFVHPLHNLVLLRCNAAVLKRAKLPVRAATLAKTDNGLRAGRSVFFVGFDDLANLFSVDVTIAAVYLPSGKDEWPMGDMPRFRERNLEIAVLADSPNNSRGGVLCDASGNIHALHAQFSWQASHNEESTESFGIPVGVWRHLLVDFRGKVPSPPPTASLDIELSALDLATLQRNSKGPLPSRWRTALCKHRNCSSGKLQVLRVHRIRATGASQGLLEPGDVLMTVAGKVCPQAHHVEEALRSWRRGVRRKSSSVQVSVFRHGREVTVDITPSLLHSAECIRLLVWSGIVLRATPPELLEKCGDNAGNFVTGVYAQVVMGGSPADAQEFPLNWFLREVDSRRVDSLDEVLAALAPVHRAGDRRWVRLTYVRVNGQEHVKAIQYDPVFFPTLELRRLPAGQWTCAQL